MQQNEGEDSVRIRRWHGIELVVGTGNKVSNMLRGGERESGSTKAPRLEGSIQVKETGGDARNACWPLLPSFPGILNSRELREFRGWLLPD